MEFTVDYDMTFLVAMSRLPDKNSSGEWELTLASGLRLQLTVVGKAWWQEREADDHDAPGSQEAERDGG